MRDSRKDAKKTMTENEIARQVVDAAFKIKLKALLVAFHSLRLCVFT